MKRTSIKLIVALSTFLLSLAVVAIYFQFAKADESEWLPPSLVFNEDAPIPTKNLCCCQDFTNESTASTQYFPTNVLGNERTDSLLIDWYSKHLRAMNEPSFLSLPDGVDEAYRFLWLRSFHHPIVIHVWRIGEKRCLIVKETDGRGGYEPGKILVNQTRSLSEDEWIRFKVKLEQSNFWNLDTQDKTESGNDGARWIIEGNKEKKYHIVDRWGGRENLLACLYLLKISGLNIDEKKIY